MNKQEGIYARYSPGRDRDWTSTIEAQIVMYREKAGSPNPCPFSTLPKLPDIHTFPTGPLQALDSPEIQKAVVRGLIDEIIVHPTAALEVQCSFSNWFSNNSAIALRGIAPKTALFRSTLQFIPPPRGEQRKPV